MAQDGTSLFAAKRAASPFSTVALRGSSDRSDEFNANLDLKKRILDEGTDAPTEDATDADTLDATDADTAPDAAFDTSGGGTDEPIMGVETVAPTPDDIMATDAPTDEDTPDVTTEGSEVGTGDDAYDDDAYGDTEEVTSEAVTSKSPSSATKDKRGAGGRFGIVVGIFIAVLALVLLRNRSARNARLRKHQAEVIAEQYKDSLELPRVA